MFSGAGNSFPIPPIIFYPIIAKPTENYNTNLGKIKFSFRVGRWLSPAVHFAPQNGIAVGDKFMFSFRKTENVPFSAAGDSQPPYGVNGAINPNLKGTFRSCKTCGIMIHCQ